MMSVLQRTFRRLVYTFSKASGVKSALSSFVFTNHAQETNSPPKIDVPDDVTDMSGPPDFNLTTSPALNSSATLVSKTNSQDSMTLSLNTVVVKSSELVLVKAASPLRKLQLGNAVRFNSGGPISLVVDLHGGEEVTVAWKDLSGAKEARLPIVCLTDVDLRSDMDCRRLDHRKGVRS